MEGWKAISYDKGETRCPTAPDTVNADTLEENRDEAMSQGMGDVEPDVGMWPHKI